MYTSLEDYIERKKTDQDFCHKEVVNCLLDWYSEFGELTEKDYAYLEESWDLDRQVVDISISKEFNFD